MTLAEALQNAAQNGYTFGDWTSEEVAADLMMCCQDFEEADPDELAAAVRAYLGAK